MKIYHGTCNRTITEFRDVKLRNNLDYGNGVYFTSNCEQAKEWSCRYTNEGAVYECEIDLSLLAVLNYNEEQGDLFYLLYLCRIDLEDVAKETVDGFEEADVVFGLMLDGRTRKFKKLAKRFNRGYLTFDEFYNKVVLHEKPKDQLCFKSDAAIKLVNAGLQKKYYTHKYGDGTIIIELEIEIEIEKN